EVPFFEYSERSVPQSRHYLARLSAERGRIIRPRLSPFWLALRTTRLPFLSATVVPVLVGIAIAASHGAFTWWTALLTLVGASLAHLAANVTNDVFDTLSGADDANVNPTQFRAARAWSSTISSPFASSRCWPPRSSPPPWPSASSWSG
ncbi:MAG TPA: prenyltransferase, partial [Candidatus Limnocylindria bacterium]